MDFLSVKLRHLTYLLIAPLLWSVLVPLIRLDIARLISDVWTNHEAQLQSIDTATKLAISGVVLLFIALYWSKRSRRVYLVNFSSYKPDEEQKVTVERLLQIKEATGWFEPDALEFQRKIISRSKQ
ncbi:hypothetical protein ACLB2K_069521 [Fragaria x ananassa]